MGAAQTSRSLATLAALVGSQAGLERLLDPAPELADFADRAIGATVLQGVDATVYAPRYIAAVILGSGLFLGAVVLLQWLDRRWPVSRPGVSLWTRRLADLGIALALLAIFFPSAGLGRWPVVLLAVAVGARLAAAGRVLSEAPAMRSQFGRRLIWVLPLPWIGCLVGFLWPRSIGAVVLTAAYLSMVLVCRIRLADCSVVQLRRIARCTLPLAFVPSMLIVAIELHLAVPGGRTSVWFIGLLVALVLVAMHGWWRGRDSREPGRAWFGWSLIRWHGVIGLFGLALLRFFQVERTAEALDYLHQGEITLPAHQLLRFGRLPWIDIHPTHGFSDLFFEVLYGLVHGVGRGETALDPGIWHLGIQPAVGVVLCFLVLARFTDDLHAVLLSSLLPVLALAPSYYVPLILPVLVLPWATRFPSARRLALLVLTCVAMIGWRPDFGIFSSFAVAAALALHLVTRPAQRLATLRALLVASGIVLGGLLAFLFVLLALRPDAVEALSGTLYTYLQRSLVRGRDQLWVDWSSAVWVQYFLVPLVPLGLGLGTAVALLGSRAGVNSRRAWTLLLLCTLSVLLTVRSFERHSLIALFNPYFAPWVLALAPGALAAVGRVLRLRWYLAVTVLHCLLMFHQPAGDNGQVRLGHFAQGPGSALLSEAGLRFQFDPPEPGAARYGWEESNHEELLALLDERLDPAETFYEFVHGPLLHVLADRPAPGGPGIGVINIGGESTQQLTVRSLEARRAAGSVPVVVFRGPIAFWNQPNGVDNVVAAHRIAEWIYDHYDPGFSIAGYEVWVARDERDRWRGLELIDPTGFEQQLRLGRVPELWSRFDSVDEQRRQVGVLAADAALAPGGALLLDAPSGTFPAVEYLELTFRESPTLAAEDDSRRLLVGLRPGRSAGNGNSQLSVDLGPFREGERSLRIRMTQLYSWRRGYVGRIVLNSRVPLENLTVRLVDATD